MLDAQQIAIDSHPGYDFYYLNIDAGGLWVRRLIDRLADHQRGRHSSVATATS
jgi:5-deoxy-D-glucuronate isomerase